VPPVSPRLAWNRSCLAGGRRILIAVSGGADSLTLLHFLAHHRDEHGCEMVACHVHHGMRGASAEADVRFLERTCREWNVPLEVVHRNVPALARERRISVEEAGRTARYHAFAEIAEKHSCDLIATAHTADDQAETVMMRLSRGAGLDGLAGIPLRRSLRLGDSTPQVVRPLLNAWRRDIEAYCHAHGLKPRQDVTNLDRRYLRSHIRLELIPTIETFDPHFRRHLVRIAAQAASERELLTPEAQQLLARLQRPSDGEGVVLDVSVLEEAPPALARRALRLALALLPIQDADAESLVIDNLLGLAAGEKTTGFTLPGGRWRARKFGADLRLEPVPLFGEVPDTYGPLPLGVSHPEGWGLKLTLEECDPPADARQPPHRVFLDAENVRGDLTLRVPRGGDRFHPLGAPGSKLLSDLFVDRKIERQRRRVWPVIEDEEGIVWVVGLAVAERCRVTDSTNRCLHLEVDPPPPIRS
jgi:tRNA(Ile)-lysidine synthase